MVDCCLDDDGHSESLTGSGYRTICEPLEQQEGGVNGLESKTAIRGRFTTVARTALLIWSLSGASFVVADGILTPAVSVISATSGTRPSPRCHVLTIWSCCAIHNSHPSDYSTLDGHNIGLGLFLSSCYFNCHSLRSNNSEPSIYLWPSHH